MNFRAIPVIALLVALASAQSSTSLDAELARLNVHTALLVHSQGVDDTPVWSPDSRFLGVNVAGKWLKVDTANVHLQEATWHEQRVAVLADKSELQSLSNEEVGQWAKVSRQGDSVVQGRSGFKAEMQRHELSSSLVLLRRGHRLVLWRSVLENCGALSLSPSGSRLAYVCELNGVLVTDVERAFSSVTPSN